jgi:hypothetical protein
MILWENRLVAPDFPPCGLWQVVAAFMAPVLGLTGCAWDCRIGTGSSPCGVDLISWGSRIWHWPRFLIFGLQLKQPCVPGCGDCCVDGRALGKCQVLKKTGREEWARTNPSWSTFVTHRVGHGVPTSHIPPPSRIERNCSLPLNLTRPFLLPSSPCTPIFPNTDLTWQTSRYAVSRPHSSHPTQYLCETMTTT